MDRDGDDSTDWQLLQAWQDGDTEAGNALVGRNFEVVYRFLAPRAQTQVDDLVQATFLTACERRSIVRPDVSFKAFLLGIAQRHLWRFYRNQGKALRHEELATGQADGDRSPSQVVAGREEAQLVLTALRTLPLDCQLLVELYYWEQLPVKEVAAVLDIPAGTVKSRLARTRALLREAIAATDAPAAIKQTTVDNLEKWARSLQHRVQVGDP